ncbi:MAG: mucin desulfatase, partial [Oscillospiraceae bacterium]
MTGYNLKEIVRQFDIIHDVLPYGDGHINDTYVVNTAKRFILQRINSDVFKRPDQVMSNIKLVTEHLRAKILACGGNPERETLTVIPTVDGKDFYKTEDGEYFRMYAFIEGARTYQIVEEPRHFYNAARAFGRFQKLLADFPATV